VNTDLADRLARAEADPEGYWASVAEELPWERPWDRVFQAGEQASFRWFAGARTNLAVNCLDRQVLAGRGAATALIWVSERGEQRRLTYAELLAEVQSAAAALRGLGVARGDRVTLYLPTCVESIALLLATVRIGAIHSVVFAGFGAGALADRVRASGSRWLFTADVTYRRGVDVPLEPIVRDAVGLLDGQLDGVVVLRRAGGDSAPSGASRDLDWAGFLAAGADRRSDPESMEANDPAFLLATSGTTATPKLVVHTHGGYQVAIHHGATVAYGIDADDVWWSTSDIGWIVGHSYVVYAPLLQGAATVAYEGAIDYPGPDQLFALTERLGVTGLFTSPTAIRALMKYGEQAVLAGHDTAALSRVFSAGEVLNPAAWRWLHDDVLGGRIPVLDNMWQTETSAPIFANPYRGGLAVRPGSAGIALPGTDAAVVGPDGAPVPPGEPGIMVLRRPTPGLTARLWGDQARYEADYWGRVPGNYYVGDSARFDADGYVWFSGRADEVIKIAAHRIGTVEVESALLTHPAVAEAGVTGRPDEVRGEVISAFVVLKAGVPASAELIEELVATVRRELGAVAVIGDLRLVGALPKTRSGKIMRRVLKAVVLGVEPGDITTIEDESSVEEATRAWRELSGEPAAGR